MSRDRDSSQSMTLRHGLGLADPGGPPTLCGMSALVRPHARMRSTTLSASSSLGVSTSVPTAFLSCSTRFPYKRPSRSMLPMSEPSAHKCSSRSSMGNRESAVRSVGVGLSRRTHDARRGDDYLAHATLLDQAQESTLQLANAVRLGAATSRLGTPCCSPDRLVFPHTPRRIEMQPSDDLNVRRESPGRQEKKLQKPTQ
jgi:hypothetical protein